MPLKRDACPAAGMTPSLEPMFAFQVRAVLLARPHVRVHIMLPLPDTAQMLDAPILRVQAFQREARAHGPDAEVGVLKPHGGQGFVELPHPSRHPCADEQPPACQVVAIWK